MIIYLRSSLFDSPAQTWVNTVNTVGVMGKGVAKEFKARFPPMYAEYRALCQEKRLSIGQLHLWRGEQQWVLNFPTKTTWRMPSKLHYVEQGLEKFVKSYRELGITSVSFPPLGCGNGNLDWGQVRPLMESYLKTVNIPVFIHNVHVSYDFVPEHLPSKVPASFEDFVRDLSHLIREHRTFKTGSNKEYEVRFTDGNDLLVRFADGKNERLGNEMIEDAYLSLLNGVLFGESFADDRTRKLKSYLFPIVAELPYIRRAKAALRDERSAEGHAYFIEPRLRHRSPTGVLSQERQGWLFH